MEDTLEPEDTTVEECTDAGNKPRLVTIPYPILILLILGVLGQQDLIPVVLGL